MVVSVRRTRARRALVSVASAVGIVAAIGLWTGTQASSAAAVPSPAHVVVVVLENHAYSQIIGSSSAPYINSLKNGGANLTQFYAETHPSQPNYYAMFSGSTQGVTDDSCVKPGFSSAKNLASETIAAGKTWASYNEGLPSQGSTVCSDSGGKYARKHNPWIGFSNVPTSTARTMTQFPTNYDNLPKMSFVVPNLCNDMHDCSVGTGDTWLKNKLGAYATWAKSNNSLLIVTTDEDNKLSGNRIATVVYGAHVIAGSSSSTTYNHYNLLRTLEDMVGSSTHAGNAASASDITGIWS
ncbi:alkaline phosphatase family protein [Planotetraspora kaengkrachanensis]|uniref:Acid phosphatase n=1 Tax=Planotetraspora kaengkrachanensis TaxID=575193 RepID=A0A8J3VCN6_9ACTN|nr:alkaline phosphatase family protein [Planotetraspora kaengkrachanensis]GIG84659.1 acid phosphatase [Planotetraspora kaengkrachanensis]